MIKELFFILIIFSVKNIPIRIYDLLHNVDPYLRFSLLLLNMEFDPLADYTRDQGTRILYERLGLEIPIRILGRDELGENECIGLYSWIIKNLIGEKEITERKGRFSGGNLLAIANHLASHATLSEIVRKYEEPKRARGLCSNGHLRALTVRYGGYLWVPLERREEFERQLTEAYFRKK